MTALASSTKGAFRRFTFGHYGLLALLVFAGVVLGIFVMRPVADTVAQAPAAKAGMAGPIVSTGIERNDVLSEDWLAQRQMASSALPAAATTIERNDVLSEDWLAQNRATIPAVSTRAGRSSPALSDTYIGPIE